MRMAGCILPFTYVAGLLIINHHYHQQLPYLLLLWQDRTNYLGNFCARPDAAVQSCKLPCPVCATCSSRWDWSDTLILAAGLVVRSCSLVHSLRLYKTSSDSSFNSSEAVIDNERLWIPERRWSLCISSPKFSSASVRWRSRAR